MSSSSSGPNSPELAENINTSGDRQWDDADVPLILQSADAQTIHCSALEESITTDRVQVTGFGFEIPGSDTILGIQLEILRGASVTDVGSAKDAMVRLLLDGAPVGDDQADTATPWPATPGYASYGGDNELWGREWTAAEINAVNFGVGLQASLDADGPQESVLAEVDHVRVTVFHAFADAPPPGDAKAGAFWMRFCSWPN